MVTRITIIILVAWVTLSMTTTTQSGKYTTEKGKIEFYSETPVENIKATSSKMVSVIDPSSGNVACVIAINTFNFDNSLMKDHFNEKYLESDKYPKATFAGVIQETVNWKTKGAYKVTVKGKLKIHGVEQERVINGTLTVVNENQVKLDAQFDVKLVDHKIEVPELVFTKIAEVINVKVKADLDFR